MSVLTRNELIEAINNGRIQIDPFSEDMLGPGSVDLSLSDEFRIFKKLRKAVVIDDSMELEKITRLVYRNSFTLLPGETILGITREKIRLAPSLCGWIQGRSRFARVGLLVHMTASFIQPGINNRQVLEISNMAPFPLILRPDTRICQVIFQSTIGEAIYHGRYKSQEKL
ncbi:MAG: dCTP deaminase [Desulfomonile tiedjei]|uniref:dCTP deaminase n=1 Tax=Desulfomonile tiedjei TaxID=2358 RepID=A0A9D6Z3W6_9BACT|nr:dCTP deaminase [Desulfomonile tiedjei]